MDRERERERGEEGEREKRPVDLRILQALQAVCHCMAVVFGPHQVGKKIYNIT